ncbi:MAG TPA: hypothetical protein VKF36_18680 [Syntrophorhabdales bacterium]|nr:hypothetical protein [Syntrophorhabdales bacterium]
MKKVCGTCLFGFDSRAGRSGIEVLCAHDNVWRSDSTESCGKWIETSGGLTKKDVLDLANRSKDEENVARRHRELLQDSKTNRRTQVLLVVLGALLGVFGTLVSQYILAVWRK